MTAIDSPAGDLAAADTALVDRLRPSPNHGVRAAGKAVDLVLLHYTGMPAGRGLDMAERAIRWLADPRSQVSAHYVVGEDGRVTQMVAEARRAWHAGVSFWQGETDINSVSIGIEIAHAGHPGDPAALPDADGGAVPPHPGYLPFPAVQIERVVGLVADIVARHRLDPGRVLAHSDVAPGRKADPGEGFPWQHFFNRGLGLWTEPVCPSEADSGLRIGDRGPGVAEVQRLLRRLGYGIASSGLFDESTRNAITAFQRHWRQSRIDGIADRSTVATLERLLASTAGRDETHRQGREQG
jgi:N-acetylmuramoyl-L-alanine amidase